MQRRSLFSILDRDAAADSRPAGPADEASGQDAFIAQVSHELRTPLAAIMGALSVIRAGAAGEVPPRAAELIDAAQRNAQRMMELVDDLLDSERIAAGRLELDCRQVDLHAVVREAVEGAKSFASTRNVTLALDAAGDPAPVAGDARRLGQAITNLLSNAAKFSDPGDRVVVSVETDAGRARVTVADRGPGIPAELQHLVFDSFWTRDSGDGRNPGGTGLGLGIARALAEAHGGAIGFASRPGETRFWIDLPSSGATAPQ